MKVDSKTMKVKLERGEVRVGNFFVKEERGHIKVQDISSLITHRVSKYTAVGMWMKNMLEKGEAGQESLRTYAATLFSLSLVAPDQEFIEESLKMADAHLKKHPEWYGVKADATESEDAESLADVEGLVQMSEEMEKAMEESGDEAE